MPSNEDREANLTTEGDPSDAPESNKGSEGGKVAAPTFSLDGLRDQIAEGINSAFDRVFARSAAAQQAPADEPEPAGATTEEFESDLPTAIRKTIDKALHPVRREMSQFRSFGLAKLGDLAKQSASNNLPYYKAYQREIEQRLATLDPALRADAVTIKIVHDTVAMEHLDEIRKSAADEKARQLQQSHDTPSPGSVTGREQQKPNTVPSPADLGFSEDQIADINARGGPDAFARRISGGRFTDWAAYTRSHAAMRSAPRARGGFVLPFRRLEQKKPATGNEQK